MADTSTTNKPSHDVCFVRGRDGQKGYWTTIGAGWAHRDGGGMNVDLRFLPVDFHEGRIVIRLRTEKPAEGEVAQ